ncbi:MAG: immunity 53 family protein [Lachnospiraceae bacterium]|nr:immunity 53 family protein [Lachnospiraceae bacterium]
MEDLLRWLEKWHKDNAFDDGYALNIRISTLDNPGWSVDIDLADTKYSRMTMGEIQIDNSDDDWIDCRIINHHFRGSGDCLKLEKILAIFREEINSVDIANRLEQFPDAFRSVKKAILSGNGYWYPFETKYKPEKKTTVYNLDMLYKKDPQGIGSLKEVFSRAGIRQVKGFHPYDYAGQATWIDIPDIIEYLYEEDESGYNFNWINEEYYYDTSEEWIVYVSHEGTITFCGDKLMSIAEQVIPGEYRYLNKDDEDERD